jgi:hypothetical protein
VRVAIADIDLFNLDAQCRYLARGTAPASAAPAPAIAA